MNDEPIKISPANLVKEGTIVVTKRKPETLPFLERIIRYVHLGMVAIEDGEFVVYDLHPENKNENKGSLIKRKLNDYLKDKDLIGVYDTGTSTGRIQAVAKKCWSGKYNNYHFNCQKFIDYVTHKELSSDLYSYYAGMIIMLAVSGIIILGGTIYVLANNKTK